MSRCTARSTGKKPYEGDNAKALAKAKIKGRIKEPPRDTRIPRWLRRIIYRGLSPRADDRWPSMNALLDAIHRRRRKVGLRWIAGGVVLALVAGASAIVGSQRPQPEVCTGGEERASQVWNADRRQRVHESFLSTGSALAEDAWTRVSQAIDERTTSWARAHDEACISTRVRGEHSEGMLDLRMECLDARLHDIDALLGVLERADRTAVEHSTTAVQSLTPLARCEDTAWLHAQVKPPENTAIAGQVESLRRKLAESRALYLSGQYAEGLEISNECVTSAGRLDYPPLLAEAWEQVGSMQIGMGEYEEAEKSLRESFVLATSAKHDRIASMAATQLVDVVGNNLARPGGRGAVGPGCAGHHRTARGGRRARGEPRHGPG